MDPALAFMIYECLQRATMIFDLKKCCSGQIKKGNGREQLAHDFFEKFNLEVAIVTDGEPASTAAKGLTPCPRRALEIKPGEPGRVGLPFGTWFRDRNVILALTQWMFLLKTTIFSGCFHIVPWK